MKAGLHSAGIVLCAAVCASIANQSLLAQTAYPMLMSVRPVAVQAGTTAEVTVSSRYTMFGAYQVLVSSKGVTAEVASAPTKQDDPAKKPNVEKLKIKLTATGDALPGGGDVRIAT